VTALLNDPMFRRGQLFERDSIAIMLNSIDGYKMKDGELVLMTGDEMRRHIYGLVLNRP
jgi:hypothetical protein